MSETDWDENKINEAFKGLISMYKEEQKYLSTLREGLLDWKKCDEFSCGECKGEMFEKCITGIRSAIAALCSSNSFILEQLSIAMSGINELKGISVGDFKTEKRKEDEETKRLYQ